MSAAEPSFERLVEEPSLHEPILVVMLTGWIDASGAAALAAETLAAECATSPIVRFDDDTYIDYRARRPTMELRDGINTNLRWSTIEMSAGVAPTGDDIVFLTGPEPDMAWQRFARDVSTLATAMGVTKMVAFGAYPFAAPHTRTARLSCSSPSTDVLASVPFARSSVDVPAGVAAALEHALHAARIPALGLWVQVPHYVSAMAYPASSVALLDGFAMFTGVRVDAIDLRASVAPHLGQINQMIADNEEHQAMIRQLEQLYDAETEETSGAGGPGDGGLELQSGDDLAAEIQRFLRDQN
jgi:hypothetical protein